MGEELGKGQQLVRKGGIVFECRGRGRCRRWTGSRGRREHTLSVDATYLEQEIWCMQRRICWREVRSDRMKSDVRVEGIVLIVMSWRCIFGGRRRDFGGEGV